MNGLTSNSLRMMERSMDFLWTKQAALLDNISNAETPGYKAKTVTFEQTLDDRLKRGDRAQAGHMRRAIERTDWVVEEAQDSTRLDGNGVNVGDQSVELVRTAYQLQYTMQTISSDLSILRTAVTG